MAEQLSLDGLASAPPTDRLFFALFPDQATAGRIEALARDLRAAHGLTGQLLARERFHVTLCHLGDYHGLNRDVADKAMAAGGLVKAGPFPVRFDRAASFAGRSRKRPSSCWTAAALRP